MLNTLELSIKDIPTRYEWSTFSRFALTFDPSVEQKKWKKTDHIDKKRLPRQEDTITGLREYLYSMQRINNQFINDEKELKYVVELIYKILKTKLENQEDEVEE